MQTLPHTRPNRVGRFTKTLQWLSSHWALTLSGWFLAVLMSVLYFVDAGRTDLAYSESPSRTTIVTSSAVDGLRVSFNGRDLRGGVSGVKLLIWNRGNRAIAPDDVLEPIRIVSDPPVHILQVRVERRSRGAIKLGCFAPTANGEIGLGWRILERGDAAVVSLIYAGPRDASFNIVGSVVGQHRPNERPYGSWQAPEWPFYAEKLWPSILLVLQAIVWRRYRGARIIALLGAAIIAVIALRSLGVEWLFAAAPSVPF
jgi:hypothetical protein